MGVETKTSVYIDACLVIYLVEKHELFFPLLENRIAEASNIIFAISDLTKMECLILPTRNEDDALLRRYKAWLAEAWLLTPVTDVFEKATELRAGNSTLKTPDALHLAAALHHNCDEFWTNDNRLTAVAPGIVRNILTT